MNDLMCLRVWACFSRCPSRPSVLQIFNPKSSRPSVRRLILPSNSQSRTAGEGGAASEDLRRGGRRGRRRARAPGRAQGWPESKGKQLEPTNLRGREKNAAGGRASRGVSIFAGAGERLDNEKCEQLFHVYRMMHVI